ncbi:hypothetical protein DFQ04_1271 [Algoriphagus boseongensis]|uniref:Peptidase M23-like protein n=1 Tax=Algoriphagus boseongensis TaxID=1442587 RepID=A0A4R6T8T1_9BACT|nr:hypothetical protein [Algoriphagus boseongensis]TDQ19450.1 hypothetical protein DFQ04_1271 [Algoriphagus boseongensis]
MRIIASLFLFLLVNSLFAQVQIVAEQDQDRNLTLFSMNPEKIPYTIRIEFSSLENLESMMGNIIFSVAEPGKSTLVKLKSIYVNEKTGFRYNTKLFKGDFTLPTQKDQPYLIPLEEGTKLSMRPLIVQVNSSGPKSSNPPYSGVGFFFEKPALVCAPRKGIISEIKMDKEVNTSGPTDFESENYLEIYHQDGTFTRLSGLKANSQKASLGETVIPGQPIAETIEQANPHVKMIQSRWEMGEMGMIWINFPIKILSASGESESSIPSEELISQHPKEVIILELDKKELKKFQK